MSIRLEIRASDGVADVERKIAQLQADLSRVKGGCDLFGAKLASDRRASFFKDIWAAMAVAGGIDHCARARVVAWGLKDWSNRDDEDAFALSLPSILALQRGARIVTDARPPEPLEEAEVKRNITRHGGVIGTGGRQRTVIELDPDLPVAAALTTGAVRRDTFFEFVRGVLSLLEIGALARKGAIRESPAKGTILEFLYELHSNGYEHAQLDHRVRFLRLQKHLYPHRDVAARHAIEFDELLRYIGSQEERPSNRQFNLVEASVSDFGPGILDGFLSTFAGRAFANFPRRELMDKLLHEQLSSKSSDPNAGLGIGQALAAAREIDAFVSLRTGEFWLTMRGKHGGYRMSFREGALPTVVGTHWQLLLRDPTEDGRPGESRA